MKILLVEDERKMAHYAERALSELSYVVTVAGTLKEAQDAMAETAYDVVILDLGLPDGDGLDLLALWRKLGHNEPVIILSARDAISDRINGLNLGADDYLAKPFAVDELVARVRSLWRRHAGVKTTRLEHRGLKLDLLSRVVTYQGRALDLTAKEFALLELFLHNPGRVLTRTLIAERVWEASYDIETNLIDVYMRKLRQKIGQSEDEPPLFKTVRGSGYQLC